MKVLRRFTSPRVIHHGRPWRPGSALGRTLCRRGYWETPYLTQTRQRVTCAHCINALPSGRPS